MSEVFFRTMGPQAWRSLWRNKRRTFLTTAAIVFGLELALTFLTMGNGVYRKVINDAARIYGGHFTVEHTDYRAAPAIGLTVSVPTPMRESIESLSGVVSTRAQVQGQGMVRSSRGATGVVILGVEPAAEKKTSPIADNMVAGHYLEPNSSRKIIVGQKLAQRLKVRPGKKLVLAANSATGELVEELFRVEGIFEMGSPEMDGYLVQIPISDARRFYHLQPEEASALAVLVADPADFSEALQATRDLVPKIAVVRPWDEILTSVASFIRLDRTSNITINTFIVLMGLFTIWNTILMSVLERTREFAVMLALGTEVKWVRLQVLAEGIWIGFLGCGIGLTCAFLTGHWMETVGIDFSAFMEEVDGQTVAGFKFPTHVYGKIWWEMYAAFGGLVMGATVLMSTVASRHIKKIDVANVLR